jgi:hypothetical protein
MAIDFPNSPTTGDTHTVNGRTWTYDGTGWVVYGPSIDATVLRIDSGNNRVGINNSSPTVTLDVTGDTAISGNLAVGSITDVEADITTLQSDMTTAQGDITTLEAGATATSIKVYSDATARNTAVPSPAAGDLSFLTSTASVEVYDGSAWVSVGGATMITKVARFTASGTWTVPAGVTYAIAHVRAGGGGCSTTSAPAGVNSSVALPDGTVTADAGNGMSLGRTFGGAPATTVRHGSNRSGQGGAINHYNSNAGDQQAFGLGGDGAYEVRGSSVTAGASIAVTVGAGGSGTANGGSGYVWIEYQQEA